LGRSDKCNCVRFILNNGVSARTISVGDAFDPFSEFNHAVTSRSLNSLPEGNALAGAMNVVREARIYWPPLRFVLHRFRSRSPVEFKSLTKECGWKDGDRGGPARTQGIHREEEEKPS
jgi:hypothetical protein